MWKCAFTPHLTLLTLTATCIMYDCKINENAFFIVSDSFLVGVKTVQDRSVMNY